MVTLFPIFLPPTISVTPTDECLMLSEATEPLSLKTVRNWKGVLKIFCFLFAHFHVTIIEFLEWVQRKAAKLVKGLEKRSYKGTADGTGAV